MNCWEYKNCTKDVYTICPAYPESGASCWMLSDVKCQGRDNGFSSLDEQVAYCGRCDFFARGSTQGRQKIVNSCTVSGSSRRMKKNPVPVPS
jgi:hypothetical protein